MNSDSPKANEARQIILAHKREVAAKLTRVIAALVMRAAEHDDSKLLEPEYSAQLDYVFEAAEVDFGSPEYEELSAKYAPARRNHYIYNRHHAEHHPDGIDGMNLLDLLEMLCDWSVAAKYFNNSARRSLRIQQDKLGISDQLYRILFNTVGLIEGDDNGRNK